MRYILQSFLPILVLVFTSCNNQGSNSKIQESEPVFPQGKKITNANFTGTAYLHPLIDADSLNSISVGNVTFEAGARSKWHSHPAGQILLAISGVGYYQEKGKPKRILRKGDAIKCPPNVSHWHGASVDSAFGQIAITGREKGETIWLDDVSEEEVADLITFYSNIKFPISANKQIHR